MKEFLELADYKLLVLVGDTYQIESIEFGNWFDTIRGFLPEPAICELVKPYRSNSKQLQALWDNVRKMEDDILDRLQAGGYSVNLDPSSIRERDYLMFKLWRIVWNKQYKSLYARKQ